MFIDEKSEIKKVDCVFHCFLLVMVVMMVGAVVYNII